MSRRPPGMKFETWVEQQIRESMDRGEFDELDGRGRPISDLDEPNDDLRWVRQKLKREGFTYLPASLLLRKEATEVRAAARDAATEAEVRRLLAAVNVKLLDAVRMAIAGPPIYIPPYDIEKAVAEWRAAHPDRVDRAEGTSGHEDTPGEPARRRRRWRRSPAG